MYKKIMPLFLLGAIVCNYSGFFNHLTDRLIAGNLIYSAGIYYSGIDSGNYSNNLSKLYMSECNWGYYTKISPQNPEIYLDNGRVIKVGISFKF